ncbi:MAG: tetraacyldisaccharide 4'-kinase [Fimbriimonas sp.]|nr:tetraacyldisaccharide 4'-kinase [Fimbriimonas sp.]
MHPVDIWEGRSFKATVLRGFLTPLSWLYAAGWQGYLALYRSGIKKASEPHRPIICIGNLVVGGTGKSPLTLYFAELLAGMDKEVVVGCSGYGSPRAEAASIAPEGPLDAREWGDEPAMVRWLLPHVPLVVGRRRVLAAEAVHRAFPDAVLLMDDGFQHLPLRKQVSIVLDDARPVNARCLPAGPYREPRKNRRRADLVLPSDFACVPEPMRLIDPDGNEQTPTSYSVLCALGQPDRFLTALEAAFPNSKNGGVVRLLPDHDPLTGGTLLDTFPQHLPIVVTAKDWVKLRSREDVAKPRFLIALRKVRVEPEAEFKVWLKNRLDE